MSLESFMSEFERATISNPIVHIERLWLQDRKPVVGFEVSVFNGSIRLSNIRSLDAGRGYAAKHWIGLFN